MPTPCFHVSHASQGSPTAAPDALAPNPLQAEAAPDEAAKDLEAKRQEALEASRAAEAVRGRSQELLGRFADMSLARDHRAEASFAAKAAALDRSTAAAKQVLRITPPHAVHAAVHPSVHVVEEDATPGSQDDVLLYGIHPASEGDDLLVEELPVESSEEQQWVCGWGW